MVIFSNLSIYTIDLSLHSWYIPYFYKEYNGTSGSCLKNVKGKVMYIPDTTSGVSLHSWYFCYLYQKCSSTSLSCYKSVKYVSLVKNVFLHHLDNI